MTTKIERRIKIKYRVRNKVSGTAARPRMSVFRSNKQIYVQIIDDLSGKTLAAASSLGMTEKLPKKEVAAKVGEMIAKKAQEAGITTVVFDRNGYLYHGRVKDNTENTAPKINTTTRIPRISHTQPGSFACARSMLMTISPSILQPLFSSTS